MSTPIPGEPLGATALWRTTVRKAGLQCECHGTCGKRHASSGGHCDHGLHKTQWTQTAEDRLYVTQRGSRHVALCQACHDGHRTIDNRAAKAVAAERLELFALPGLGLNDAEA